MKKSKITAAEFDAKFESGEDISEHVDFSAGVKMVNVTLPEWTIGELDRESNRRGVARQALIKMWVVDRLDALRAENGSTKARKSKRDR